MASSTVLLALPYNMVRWLPSPRRGNPMARKIPVEAATEPLPTDSGLDSLYQEVFGEDLSPSN